MILWGFSVDSSSPEISLETATTVPATVTSSDVPTVVSELMTGNVSSVIDNFAACPENTGKACEKAGTDVGGLHRSVSKASDRDLYLSGQPFKGDCGGTSRQL